MQHVSLFLLIFILPAFLLFWIVKLYMTSFTFCLRQSASIWFIFCTCLSFNNMKFFLNKCNAECDPHREIVCFLRNVYKVLNKSCHSMIYCVLYFQWLQLACLVSRCQHFNKNKTFSTKCQKQSDQSAVGAVWQQFELWISYSLSKTFT